VLEDYGYKKPSANLVAQTQNPGGYQHDSMEMFDYHYGYVDTEGKNLVDKDVGGKFTKYRLEAAQSLDKRRSAKGRRAVAVSGWLVTLERHPDSARTRNISSQIARMSSRS